MSRLIMMTSYGRVDVGRLLLRLYPSRRCPWHRLITGAVAVAVFTVSGNTLSSLMRGESSNGCGPEIVPVAIGDF